MLSVSLNKTFPSFLPNTDICTLFSSFFVDDQYKEGGAMASTSWSQDKLTGKRSFEEELEVIENGGLSPQPSVKTDDDACSEIIRIEQRAVADERYRNSTMGRFVRTLQVGYLRYLRSLETQSRQNWTHSLSVPTDVS